MGIRGRFLYYGAATIGGSFIGYAVVSSLEGSLSGFATLLAILGIGYLTIFIKQKKGLHSKKIYQGVIVYKDLFITRRGKR